MNEYTYIIFDHKGKRLGKIEFGKRISVPSASEIEEAIKDGFPNGATYKLIVPINVCISQCDKFPDMPCRYQNKEIGGESPDNPP